jgi:hypothetical protein
VAELGILLFVKGIPEIVNNAVQEAILDEPRGPNEFPLLNSRASFVVDVKDFYQL